MRTKLYQTALAVIIVAVLSTAALAAAPRLVNYQGRVLTAAGAPVANGPHTFDFRIYPTPAGGILQWDELGVAIVTTNGLFTYALGSPSAFPNNMFTLAQELWLEVTVDGQLQSPRTRFISNPYAETAGNLSLENPFFPGQLIYLTDPSSHSIATFGADGFVQTRLWGPTWGELLLYDGDPSNDRTVELKASLSGGGQLILTDDNANTTIDLHGGQTGNTSVDLPDDAIYDLEILDEPGVASEVFAPFFFTPVPGDQKIDSVDITIPSSGYVEVTAGAYLNMAHTVGTASEIWLGITKAPPLFFTDPGTQVCSVPATSASALYQYPCTSTRMYAEGGPGTYRYYVNVVRLSAASPSLNVAGTYIRAKYYPTAYGSIVVKSSDNESAPRALGIPSDGTKPVGDLGLKIQTLEQINAKLEADRAALRAENDRLRKEQKSQNESLQSITPNSSNDK